MMDIELFESAKAVRLNAYAPYSGYLVGAALRDEHGRIWQGCNVENISFGATICAERTALSSLIAGGGHQWTSCIVVTKDGGTPCGMCRQFLQELANGPDCPITCATPEGQIFVTTIAELLPHAFTSQELNMPDRQ